MSRPKSKDAFYLHIREVLIKNGFVVNPYREINYGIQFMVFEETNPGLIRIYQNKKGLKVDMSQVKDPVLKDRILRLVPEIDAPKSKPPAIQAPKVEATDPTEIIGIDESGKGDYFGALVVAAVYVNKENKEELIAAGVQDSKLLTDQKVLQLAPLIKERCPHSLVILHNYSYNEVYEKFQNLNHMLAWGHARVLESTLEQVDCKYALSDQFADPSLVKNALMVKGKLITLFQRTKAESNIAVAAASIVARASFLTDLEKLNKTFAMTFPKGASKAVNAAGRKFVEKFGKDELQYAAKLHFKITNDLEA